MVATPMYGGMCTGHYLNGILSLTARMRQVNVPVYYGYMMNESLITRARNELARIFIEKGQDYLMFIDADIQFTGQDVATLMAADKDIICGIYPKKEVDWDRVNQAAKDGEENLQDFAGAYVMNFNTDRLLLRQIRTVSSRFVMAVQDSCSSSVVSLKS
jgi:hypothetical protein